MEIFDLFDKNRCLSGETMVRGTKVPENRFRQVVHIVIFNSEGKMLIQQRQSFKKLWPNMWDISVGGSVISGENSYQGAERELFEELGIKMNLSNIRPAFTANFEGGFDDFYIVNLDININDLILQESEVQSAKWASLEEVKELKNNGKFLNYRNGVVELLFDLQNRHYGFVND